MRRVRSLLILCLLALLPMMGVEAATVLSYVGALAGPADGDGKRVLHGVVTDEKGEPLPGVAVFPTNYVEFGAATDNDGKYVLQNVPAEAKSLTFLMLGMKKEIVMIGKKDKVDVMLIEDVNSLEDVVVTGYQKIDKRYSTSAVTSLKMEDVHLPGVASLDQMLEGKIPDMVFTTNSGEINATPRLRIRGTSTLIGNREPLWVLDGIVLTDPVALSPDVLNDPDYVNRIGNAISGINPQDILRIDVLKDAAATALYGTRAANGVIVITTKSGREGKPVLSYSATMTGRRRPYYTDSKINLMNSDERIQFSQFLVDQHYLYPSGMPLVGYENALNNLYAGVYTQSEFDKSVQEMASMNTDWFDILCHNSFSHDHSISVSGGSDKIRYYASLGYTDQDDVIKNTKNRRYTGMAKLDIQLMRKLDLSLNINGYHNDRKYNADGINPTDYAYNTSRAIPAFNKDGSYYYYKKNTGGFAGYLNYNILNELDNSGQNLSVNNIMATANLHFQPLQWLHFNGILSLNSSSSSSELLYGESTFHSSSLRRSEVGVLPGTDSEMPYGGEFKKSTTSTKGYTARLQMDINKFFGEEEQHLINFSLGGEASSTLYKGYERIDRGFYPDRGETFVVNVPTSYSNYYTWMSSNVPHIQDQKTNLLSGYATLSYTFKDLFTLNANTRYDGSNKFGSRSNEKLLPIWSVSGNANLKSIANINADWLDNLTVKASYGEQGNMLDNQTPVMVIKKGTMDAYYGEMVTTAAYFANPDLKWEKTFSTNTGFEASLFGRRLMLEAEYFYKKTTDAFMNKPISDVNGFDSYVVNSGTVVNKGYSVNVTAVPVKTRYFNWMISASLSKIMNEMKTAPGKDTYELQDFLNGTAIVKGQPIGTFYSYRFVGLSPVDGGPLFDDWSDRRSELEGLSKYDTYTKVLVASGKRDPDITGSITNTLSYKGWRLGITLNYNLGAKTRLFRMMDKFVNGYSAELNVNRELLNAWKKPGDELHTNIPAIMGTSSNGYYYYNTHWSNDYAGTNPIIASSAWDMYDYSDLRVVSADYLKIAYMSLTYELPKAVLNHFKLNRLAVTLGATNLHTFCSGKLKGQTPTQGGFSEVQLSDTPTYTLGLNLNF